MIEPERNDAILSTEETPARMAGLKDYGGRDWYNYLDSLSFNDTHTLYSMIPHFKLLLLLVLMNDPFPIVMNASVERQALKGRINSRMCSADFNHQIRIR